jgi:hypothetical protein
MRKFLRACVIALAVIFLLSLEKTAFSNSPLFSPDKQSDPQNTKKPKYDYMSTFLSRNTEPLGLKENIALKKLLQQSTIKWAIRSSKRHILD